MRITRIFENGNLIIYKRVRGHETWVPLYFESINGYESGKEFRSKAQVVSHLKKLGQI